MSREFAFACLQSVAVIANVSATFPSVIGVSQSQVSLAGMGRKKGKAVTTVSINRRTAHCATYRLSDDRAGGSSWTFCPVG